MNNIKNEYWNDIVNNFLTSGLSQKEFARQNNLKVYTLGYWVRKNSTSFNGFVEAVDSTTNFENSSKIEIAFNKMKISITGFYDEDLLLRVLRTVKKI